MTGVTFGKGNMQVHVTTDSARDYPTVYGLSYGQRASGELVEQDIGGLDVFDLVDLRDTINRVLDPESSSGGLYGSSRRPS